jgi:hypothetical protein
MTDEQCNCDEFKEQRESLTDAAQHVAELERKLAVVTRERDEAQTKVAWLEDAAAQLADQASGAARDWYVAAVYGNHCTEERARALAGEHRWAIEAYALRKTSAWLVELFEEEKKRQRMIADIVQVRAENNRQHTMLKRTDAELQRASQQAVKGGVECERMRAVVEAARLVRTYSATLQDKLDQFDALGNLTGTGSVGAATREDAAPEPSDSGVMKPTDPPDQQEWRCVNCGQTLGESQGRACSSGAGPMHDWVSVFSKSKPPEVDALAAATARAEKAEAELARVREACGGLAAWWTIRSRPGVDDTRETRGYQLALRDLAQELRAALQQPERKDGGT